MMNEDSAREKERAETKEVVEGNGIEQDAGPKHEQPTRHDRRLGQADVL